MRLKKLIFLLSILLCMVGTKVSAYDIEVKNADDVTIYYNYINDGKELEVINGSKGGYGSYSGSVVIPAEVTYKNITRKVTSIGEYAFHYCFSLTSVTIPNSVTIIRDMAFKGSKNLTSITIGKSVTSIGSWAFDDCTSLTSVNITDIAAWCKISFSGHESNPLSYAHSLFLNGVEIKDLVIPNSVTSIGYVNFYNCNSLNSIVIPNSVTSIGDFAFYKCSNLTSVTIGNSVKSIGYLAFGFCFSLKSITIPNSVTDIGSSAFYYCRSMTSATIGNSVTNIGSSAFYECSSMTSVTIPNSVKSIGSWAFNGCNLSKVYSKIENPFNIIGKSDNGTRTFSLYTFTKATLYVPVGTINKYKSTEGWKDFANIEEDLTNGVANVSTRAALIQCNGGIISVQGCEDGEQVIVYDINGVQKGSAISQNGQATIYTSIQPGSVAIVKTGNRSTKITVK